MCFSRMADQTVVPTWLWRLSGTASRRLPKLDADLHSGADVKASLNLNLVFGQIYSVNEMHFFANLCQLLTGLQL